MTEDIKPSTNRILLITLKMADTFTEAVELMKKSQYAYAIYLLSISIAADYKKPEALCKRGICYMEINKYKKAIDDFQMSLKLNKTIEEGYIKQSKCYLMTGNLDKSIETLKHFTEIEPNNEFAAKEFKKLMELKKNYNEAKKSYKNKNYSESISIIDKNKEIDYIKLKLLKVECLIYLKKHEMASKIINEILNNQNDNIEAKFLSGVNLLYQGKYSLGLAELKEIKSMPLAAKMIYIYKTIMEKTEKAQIANKNNNLEEAKRIYEEILSLHPKNSTINKLFLINLAEVYLKLKKYDKAIETSTIILEESLNLNALKIRATCNLNLQEYELALYDYENIVLLEKNQKNLMILKEIKSKFNENLDYYQILELPRNATKIEIKRAYHKLALRYHPDKNYTTSKYYRFKCEKKFAKISRAYTEILRNFR